MGAFTVNVDAEGVSILRGAASSVNSSAENMVQAVSSLSGMIETYKDTLGPHYQTIESAIEGIKACLKNDTDSLFELETKLSTLADAYEDEIDSDPFVKVLSRVR